MRLKSIFAMVFMSLCAIAMHAQDKNSEYQRGNFTSDNGTTINYRLLEPETLQPGEKYPLVLFMHGAGERGADNEAQLTHGSQMWLNPVNRDKYPAFVLIPQCPEDGYWAYNERPVSFAPSEMPILEKPTSVIVTVVELVDSLRSLPYIDSDRIYVMGLSMGGMATYDLAIRYPEIFAAAVPICGTVNPARLDKAIDVKFRIYHGDNDNVVTVEGSRQAYKKLKEAGADVTYTEYPGVTHGSWNNAFNDKELIPWLFGQHK